MGTESLQAFALRRVMNLRSTFLGQSGVLVFFRVFVMGIGFVTTPIVATTLGASEYGHLSFTMNIVNWLSLLFTLGLDSAPKMLANLSDDLEQRKLIGGFFVFTFAASLLFSITTGIVSFFVDALFQVENSSLLRMAAPLVWIIPMQLLVEWMIRGLQRTMLLSWIILLPRLVYLLVILMIVKLQHATATSFYLAFLLTGLLAPLIGWIMLRPSMLELHRSIRAIVKDLRLFGRNAYLGRVPAVMVYSLDRLILGRFATVAQIGFYNLGFTLTTPVALVGDSISQVSYRDFARSPSIPRLVWLVNLAAVGLAATGSVIGGTIFITYWFPKEFRSTIPLLWLLGIALFFQAICPLLTAFISVKGRGDLLRNAGWSVAILNILLSILIIPFWQTTGAAVVACLVNIAWLLITWHFYHTVVEE